MQTKKIPMRMCVGCGEVKPKKELVRVVKAPDVTDEAGNVTAQGEISLDMTGKKAGRGAYICPNLACLKNARKTRRIANAFHCAIPEEVYDRMEAQISGQ